MAGQQELIIKLIILMLFLVGLGIAGYFGYKEYEKRCPKGLMVCLGLEDEPDKGPGTPDVDPSDSDSDGSLNLPQSELYKTCGRYVVPQETRICKNDESGLLGVMWDWSQSQTDNARQCKDATAKWKVFLSSSLDSHATKYEYIINSSGANSILIDFSSGYTSFLKGHNIKIYVVPLNTKGEKITTELLVQTLDNKNSSTDCSGYGDKKAFSLFTITEKPTQESVPAVDCQGYWKEQGTCKSVNNYCEEWGTVSNVWITTTESKGTGKKCPVTRAKIDSCRVRTSCTPAPPDASPPSDCRADNESGVINTNNINRIIQKEPDIFSGKDVDRTVGSALFPIKDVNGYINQVLCTKEFRENESDKPGFFITSRYLQDVDSALQGTCRLGNGQLASLNVCNNFLKPVNCEGTYALDPQGGGEIVEYCKQKESDTEYHEYKITQEPHKFSAKEDKVQQGTGTQCPEISDKKLTNIYTVHKKEATGEAVPCSYSRGKVCELRTCTNVEPEFVKRHQDSKTVVGYK